MPNFELKKQPQYDLKSIETDSEIHQSQILEALGKKQGVTLCIRSKEGHKNRGGYFFSIEKSTGKTFNLLTMESDIIVRNLDIETLTKLINHAAGLKFDENMLQYCQNEINFRTD